MKKKWNFVGLLLAVLVAMMMVLPVKEAAGQTGRYLVVETEDMVNYPWDSQFFIVPNITYKSGAKWEFSMKVKADKETTGIGKDGAGYSYEIYGISTQLHGEPGVFKSSKAIGTVPFTTEWRSFTCSGNLSEFGSNFSIVFNLNHYNSANKYYFDDISMKINGEEVIANGSFEKDDFSCFLVKKARANSIDEVTDANIFGSKAYAVLDYNGTLTFYNNENKPAGAYSVKDGTNSQEWSSSSKIKKVVFDQSFKDYKPTSCSRWFFRCSNLAEVVGIDKYLNTTDVTDMSYMFYGCSQLKKLDLSGFDVQKVSDFTSMFADCSNLASIIVAANWNRKNCSSSGMFYGCNHLIGGKGTTFNSDYINLNYAKIDGGTNAPGYFTKQGEPAFTDAYAILNDGTLTFYCAKNTSPTGAYPMNRTGEKPKWNVSRSSIKKVVFDESFKDYTPITCEYWFDGCSNLAEIVDMDKYLNTEYVTNMAHMFSECKSLTGLNLSNFNTINVSSMDYMLWGCSSIESVDLSGFNTLNVTYMSYMFGDCSKLKNLNLSSFITLKVSSMNGMFSGCFSLESIDLSRFYTENVTDMSAMFYECSSLESVDLRGFYTPNVTSMSAMFYGCCKLQNINASSFNTASVTNMSSMFYNCSSLGSIDLSNFNTTNVTSVYEMFKGCSKLKTLNLSNFNTANVTNIVGMFNGCSSLTSLDLGSFNSSKVSSMSNMFSGCESLKEINLSSFNTSNVTSMESMFFGCSSLESLDMGKFDTQKLTTMREMFSGCSSLKSLDLSNFITDKVTNMSGMFRRCSSLAKVDLSSFNTEKVVHCDTMFRSCNNLKTIYVGKYWNLDKAEGYYMFDGCKNLVGGKGSTYHDDWNADAIMAHVDCGKDCPGYLTDKNGDASIEPKRAYIVLNAVYGDDWNLESCNMTYYYDGNVYKYKTPYFDENNPPSKGDKFLEVLPINKSSYGHESDKVVFDASFKDYKPTSCAKMFSGFSKLIEIVGLENLNTEACTDMTGMFQGCSSLKSLDLRSFNTSKVTKMNSLSSVDAGAYSGCTGMFKNCNSLEILDLSSFDTRNVTCMAAMFGDCTNLKELKLGNFNTGNVTNMLGMFKGCKSLKTLDLSGFNTENVTAMNRMFEYCTNLEEVDLSNFNTENVKTFQLMFDNCRSLTELDLTSFSAKSVVSDQMFTNCTNLEKVFIGYVWKGYTNTPFKGSDKLKGNIFDKLTYIDKGYATFDNGVLTFGYATSSDKIPSGSYPLDTEIPGWSDKALKIEKVVFPKYFKYVKPTTCYGWFFNCRNLTEIEGLEYLNTENVENMSLMFAGCKELKELDLRNFNTQNVTNMKGMFGYNDKEEGKTYYCSNLETIYVGDGWTTKYTEDDDLFDGCTKLKGDHGTVYNAQNINIDYAKLDGGKNAPGYFSEKQKTVIAIEIATLPTKTEYFQGEDLNHDGGELLLTFDDNTTGRADLSTAEISGYDKTKVGTQTLTVKYSNYETKFNVTVKERKVVSISVSKLPKNEYILDQNFSADGGELSVKYNDESTEKVKLSSAQISGYDASKLGEQTLTVEYLGLKTEFKVTVSEKKEDNPNDPNNDPTPVSEISANSIKIWSSDKTIIVENANANTEIRIADMSGRLVKTIKATADRMEIPMLKSGIYIVKTGAKTQKVMIQ